MTDPKAYQPPVVMTFSSLDSSGGAGISADVEAIISQGCHCAPVASCLTIQDSVDMSAIIPMDESLLIQCARAILEDMPVAAFKVDLLGSSESIEALHSIFYDYQSVPLVYQPVLVSQDGTELVEDEVIESIRQFILPLTRVVTVNRNEAALLVPEADNEVAMANGLMDLGAEYILITGAEHGHSNRLNRLFYNRREIDRYEWAQLPHSYKGAGNTLSATLAALLSMGLDPLSAVREAQNFTWQSLNSARRIGMGRLFPNRLFWAVDEDEE